MFCGSHRGRRQRERTLYCVFQDAERPLRRKVDSEPVLNSGIEGDLGVGEVERLQLSGPHLLADDIELAAQVTKQ